MLGADGTEVRDRFGSGIGGVSDGDGVFVRIQADKQYAMFFHGAAPQFYAYEHVKYGSG